MKNGQKLIDEKNINYFIEHEILIFWNLFYLSRNQKKHIFLDFSLQADYRQHSAMLKLSTQLGRLIKKNLVIDSLVEQVFLTPLTLLVGTQRKRIES